MSSARGFLVVRVQGRLCAFDLAHVVETMRPLPVEPTPGAPPFVLGLSLIRSVPTPVIDLAAWMGLPTSPSPPTRFVTVASGTRHVALAVTAVTGVRALDAAELQTAPPLVREAAAGQVQLVGALDADLLVVLSTARMLPEDAWLPATGVAS